ncbi:hypothetical protein GF376_04960, partial [Candidatus Peregrinibacteria bacterium]|nr:hypothetical protein [Candidatus Peregrinibacteria bacterium]
MSFLFMDYQKLLLNQELELRELAEMETTPEVEQILKKYATQATLLLDENFPIEYSIISEINQRIVNLIESEEFTNAIKPVVSSNQAYRNLFMALNSFKKLPDYPPIITILLYHLNQIFIQEYKDLEIDNKKTILSCKKELHKATSELTHITEDELQTDINQLGEQIQLNRTLLAMFHKVRNIYFNDDIEEISFSVSTLLELENLRYKISITKPDQNPLPSYFSKEFFLDRDKKYRKKLNSIPNGFQTKIDSSHVSTIYLLSSEGQSHPYKSTVKELKKASIQIHELFEEAIDNFANPKNKRVNSIPSAYFKKIKNADQFLNINLIFNHQGKKYHASASC